MNNLEALDMLKSVIAYLQDITLIQTNRGQMLGASQAKLNTDRVVKVHQHFRDKMITEKQLICIGCQKEAR